MPVSYVSHETIISQLSIVDTKQTQNIQAALAKLEADKTARAAEYKQQQQQSAATLQSNSVVSKG